MCVCVCVSLARATHDGAGEWGPPNRVPIGSMSDASSSAAAAAASKMEL